MDFSFTEEQSILRDSVRKLMDRIATPDYVRRLDREQAYPYELYDAWVEAGLFRLPYPESYGGLGGSVLDMIVLAEELSRKSADFYMSFASPTFCGLNVLRKASEEQKQHWLPKLFAGEVRMAISISEPDAGSDVGAMRTTATRDGDHYVINGQKIWSTGAGAKNTVINVYVKTDTAAHYRQGLSLFLVDNDTPGLQLRKLDMLGRRCTGTYELTFDNVRVPADRLIGGENKGWDVLLSGLQVERVTSAAGNCGAAQAALDLAVDYAKERKQFGRPIGTFQANAHMLADLATEIEAARTLTWRAAWMVSTGQNALREITMAKLMSSETLREDRQRGHADLRWLRLQHGIRHAAPLPRSRSATIAAGTSQIQRNLIANLMGLKVQ